MLFRSIIKASSYNLKIRRIDICQKNPLPNYKITPDFSGSKCINLTNSTLDSENLFNTNQKYSILKNSIIENGNYRYISIMIKNKFIVSGSYNANDYFWSTSKKGPKEIIQSKSKISNPNRFTTKLINWRGRENLDNKYCNNNGGTFSRCDLQYNGYEMSGIGLDSDLVETSGNKIKFMFFISELSPMINLNQESKGYIDIEGPEITVSFNNANAKDALMSIAKIGNYGFIFIPTDSQSKSKEVSNEKIEKDRFYVLPFVDFKNIDYLQIVTSK
mgnify:CR=1 FL=1